MRGLDAVVRRTKAMEWLDISEEFVGSMVTLLLETVEGVEIKVQTSQRILERLDLSGATALFASWSPEHVHILPGDASEQRN